LAQELAAARLEETPPATADVELVRAAMRTLTDHDLELLRLTVWEELTPAEVAVVLGVPAGTARSQLHRARARLAAAITAGAWSADANDVQRGVQHGAGSGHVGADDQQLTGDPGCGYDRCRD
jgi:predicted DNA-binding protein (UPF0251 family)